MSNNTTIFVSYSHKDEVYKDEFIAQLSGLKRAGYIKSWDDRKILPGEKWNEEIVNNLNTANLVIFLVSADFIASEYIHDIEIKAAKERSKNGEATIVPIIIRSCDFENSSLNDFQALPKNAQPVASFDDRDEAWMNVVNELKRIIVGRTDETVVPPADFKNAPKMQTGNYTKYVWAALIVLVLLVIAIIKFNTSETTGIKGNNNDNNNIEIEK